VHLQPCKPTQKAYIERFNREVRGKWLNMQVFDSITHAQSLVAEWMRVYNKLLKNLYDITF